MDCASLDGIDEEAGIIESHLLELPGAASVTVEGNAPKEDMASFIDVEVGKYTVFLKAEAKATPSKHREILDENGHFFRRSDSFGFRQKLKFLRSHEGDEMRQDLPLQGSIAELWLLAVAFRPGKSSGYDTGHF